MSIDSFEIGTTYAGRVNVETLTTMPVMSPRSKFYDYSETVKISDGSVVSRGKPYATWEWGMMPEDLYEALRAICPGASASVVIRTLQDDYTTYAYYNATMIWPDLTDVEFVSGRYKTVIIRFENLTAYS
jgi:hypothetical protein